MWHNETGSSRGGDYTGAPRQEGSTAGSARDAHHLWLYEQGNPEAGSSRQVHAGDQSQDAHYMLQQAQVPEQDSILRRIELLKQQWPLNTEMQENKQLLRLRLQRSPEVQQLLQMQVQQVQQIQRDHQLHTFQQLEPFQRSERSRQLSEQLRQLQETHRIQQLNLLRQLQETHRLQQPETLSQPSGPQQFQDIAMGLEQQQPFYDHQQQAYYSQQPSSSYDASGQLFPQTGQLQPLASTNHPEVSSSSREGNEELIHQLQRPYGQLQQGFVQQQPSILEVPDQHLSFSTSQEPLLSYDASFIQQHRQRQPQESSFEGHVSAELEDVFRPPARISQNFPLASTNHPEVSSSSRNHVEASNQTDSPLDTKLLNGISYLRFSITNDFTIDTELKHQCQALCSKILIAYNHFERQADRTRAINKYGGGVTKENANKFFIDLIKLLRETELQIKSFAKDFLKNAYESAGHSFPQEPE